MALIKLEAGAEVDIATGKEVQDAADQLRADICLPVLTRRIYKAATIPAGFSGTTFLIEVGHPTTPVVWDLRTLAVLATDDHTTVANVAGAIYVGQDAAGVMSLLDCVWPGLTVPSADRYNAQVVVNHNERLYLNLAGTALAAGQQYTVTGLVIEVQVEDAPRYFG
ncbi:MAG: hypothetical protein ACRDRL_16270 [Sciscionella sp.]